MYKIYLTLLMAFAINTALLAQNRLKTFQYTPNINSRAITGVITRITSFNYVKKKLTWIHVGDTVLHVWEKDLDKKIAVGKKYNFVGVQRLTGVGKLANNIQQTVKPAVNVFLTEK